MMKCLVEGFEVILAQQIKTNKQHCLGISKNISPKEGSHQLGWNLSYVKFVLSKTDLEHFATAIVLLLQSAI